MKFKYKGKVIDFLPPIKRYMNAVERRLNLPFKIKARVMSDFTTTVCARHEAGESYEEIMKSLGTPAKAAAELNEQMSDYTYFKSPWRFLFVVFGAVCAFYLIGIISSMLLSDMFSSSIGIIGGADGPTAIYVTGDSVFNMLTFQLFAFGAGFIVCVAGFFKLSRCKNKKNK